MKIRPLLGSLATVIAIFSTSAHSQQPPDSVTSDACGDTAMGLDALFSNASSSPCINRDSNLPGGNTAAGFKALYSNTNGTGNTGVGTNALLFSTTGSNNTAVGNSALSGYYPQAQWSGNTAIGANTLNFITTGFDNTATGYQALYSNETGTRNAADGVSALFSNNGGSMNSAYGTSALYSNVNGSNNIALGYHAGYNLTTSNNIDIGNPGVAGELGVIRIGTPGIQTAVHIAAISNTKLTGSAVFVGADGQLGVLASSERYKIGIAPMGNRTDGLEQLRPVTFHLKSEPDGAVQYGFIAEEVAKVYPELVTRGLNGRIEGVRYDELAPMLVNEMQKQRAENASLKAQLHRQQQQLADIQALVAKLQDSDARLAAR